MPLLQFCEQQSLATVHLSWSVLQALPPGSGAHLLLVQTPVQQSEGAPHGASSCLQVLPSQAPATHESEQHSPEEPQALPVGVQNAAGTQLPREQRPEQQSPVTVQLAPWLPQAFPGLVQTFTAVLIGSGSHSPVQHWESAVQVAASDLHWSRGSVQRPFAQALVQQVELLAQLVEAPVQLEVQTFPAQPSPEQHWLGVVQDAPELPQAATPQVPPRQERPLQQSPSPRQSPPVAWQ